MYCLFIEKCLALSIKDLFINRNLEGEASALNTEYNPTKVQKRSGKRSGLDVTLLVGDSFRPWLARSAWNFLAPSIT